ncbi:MAG: hypothetical protein ABI553_08895 [Chloroflexota bacterium]
MLTAALALVALPGLVGSRALDPVEPLPAGAFQPFTALAEAPRSIVSIGPLDDAHLSAGPLSVGAKMIERATPADPGPTARIGSTQPRVTSGSVRRPPRYTLSGEATFYDNGTTAMRLPRGTVVVICGRGSCIERVVNDYGPVKLSRVVDLYRPDFFAICGCPWFAGTTQVTVYVY